MITDFLLLGRTWMHLFWAACTAVGVFNVNRTLANTNAFNLTIAPNFVHG